MCVCVCVCQSDGTRLPSNQNKVRTGAGLKEEERLTDVVSMINTVRWVLSTEDVRDGVQQRGSNMHTPQLGDFLQE
jgi:hypothetical protein